MEATAQNTTVTPVVNSGISKQVTKSPIVVSRVYKSDWQKVGSLTAELKQTQKTVTTYPSRQIENDKQNNIFSLQDFGLDEGRTYTNERTSVAWIDVPVDSTVESVVEKLKSFPNAAIYRVISNHPILHGGQVSQINRLKSEGKLDEAMKLKNDIANRQVIIYGQDTNDGLHKAGELILSNGKPQYKADYFTTEDRKDIDDRNSNPEDFYVTPEIKAKMSEISVASIHPDQSI